MALNGLIQGTATQKDNVFRAYIYWQIISQNMETAKSVVRLTPIVDTTGTGNTFNGTVSNMSTTINTTTKNNYGSFNSNSDSGWTYSAATSPTGRAGENILEQVSPAYMEIEVTHDDDGEKTCPLACSFSLPSGGYGPGNVSISGNAILTPIPRGILKVKVSGAWKQGLTYVKVNGSWKQATGVYIKVNGTWKQSV